MVDEQPETLIDAQERGRIERARAAATERAQAYTEMAEGHWPGFVMVGELWSRYRRLNATALAGNLAFRVFLWLLPAALMIVAAISTASDGGLDVEGEASSKLGIGGSLGKSVAVAAQDSQGSRWQAGAVALFGLLLASSGLLSALHYAAVQLWELPPRSPASRASRALKLGGSLVLVLVVSLLLGALRRSSLVVGLGAVAVGSALVALLLMALFWMMPRRSTGWIWLVPGALVGGVGYFFLQAYTSFWLPRQVSSLSTTYGTLGVAGATLGYLFLLGLIIVASTLVNTVWWDFHQDQRFGPDRVGVDQNPGAGTSTTVASMRPDESVAARTGLEDSAVQTNSVRPSEPPSTQP